MTPDQAVIVDQFLETGDFKVEVLGPGIVTRGSTHMLTLRARYDSTPAQHLHLRGLYPADFGAYNIDFPHRYPVTLSPYAQEELGDL